MTLTEFLTARIAEDEAVAREAGGDDWEVADQRKVRWTRDGGNAHGWVAIADLSTATAHIVRWDPARVLAECEAKRRIVEKLLATKHEVVDGDCWFTCAEATEDRDGGTCCDDSRRGTGCDCGRDARVESYLRLLALPYATHPDYDPAWAL